LAIVEKDVTFRQQNNAGDYDKLYVATTATQTKLTASTAALFDGDIKDADAAMAAIAGMVKNIGDVKVKILDPNGNPVQGAIIRQLTGAPVTSEDGTAHGIIQSNPITVVSPYIDLANKTVDVTDYIGSFATCEITLSAVTNKTIEIFTSKTIKFSTATSAVDVCLVGGGGSGAFYQGSTSAHVNGGGGGGGGATTNVYNVPVTANRSYQVIVGSGGAVSTYGNSSGGDSKFDSYKAAGGQGAVYGVGGQGEGGNGGNSGQNGHANTTVSMFDDGKTFYGGGGGGGATMAQSPTTGGSPNGASGASSYSNTHAGTAGIGGGGGGGSWFGGTSQDYPKLSPSEGGNGLVVIRLK
jgi:hypothetical protein